LETATRFAHQTDKLVERELVNVGKVPSYRGSTSVSPVHVWVRCVIPGSASTLLTRGPETRRQGAGTDSFFLAVLAPQSRCLMPEKQGWWSEDKRWSPSAQQDCLAQEHNVTLASSNSCIISACISSFVFLRLLILVTLMTSGLSDADLDVDLTSMMVPLF
jgi:hypothetical protein